VALELAAACIGRAGAVFVRVKPQTAGEEHSKQSNINGLKFILEHWLITPTLATTSFANQRTGLQGVCG
jgi:hypothetical protein